jgi:hypothetical protein
MDLDVSAVVAGLDPNKTTTKTRVFINIEQDKKSPIEQQILQYVSVRVGIWVACYIFGLLQVKNDVGGM